MGQDAPSASSASVSKACNRRLKHARDSNAVDRQDAKPLQVVASSVWGQLDGLAPVFLDCF